MPVDTSSRDELEKIDRRLQEIKSEEAHLLERRRGILQKTWGDDYKTVESMPTDPFAFKSIIESHEKRIAKLEQSQISESSHESSVKRLVDVMLEKRKFRSKRQWAKFAKVVPKTLYKNMSYVEKKLKEKGWKLLQRRVNNWITVWIE